MKSLHLLSKFHDYIVIYSHRISLSRRQTDRVLGSAERIRCPAGERLIIGLFHFLSVQGDGRKKSKSIFALDFFDMNILSPGKQLREFSEPGISFRIT